jgi:hypothetical protein
MESSQRKSCIDISYISYKADISLFNNDVQPHVSIFYNKAKHWKGLLDNFGTLEFNNNNLIYLSRNKMSVRERIKRLLSLKTHVNLFMIYISFTHSLSGFTFRYVLY